MTKLVARQGASSHRRVAQFGRATVSKTVGSGFKSWLACLNGITGSPVQDQHHVISSLKTPSAVWRCLEMWAEGWVNHSPLCGDPLPAVCGELCRRFN